MRKINNILAVIGIVSVFSLLLNPFGVLAVSDSNHPNVRWEIGSAKPWWITDRRDGTPQRDYRTITNVLNDPNILDDPLIQENLGIIYVNPYNNTVFVGVKNPTQDIKQHIMGRLPLQKNVTIIFKDVSANKIELDRYQNNVTRTMEELAKQGINWSSVTKNENSTISVGVVDLTPEKLATIENELKAVIPLELLVICNSGAITLTASQTEANRPFVAGVKGENYNGATWGFMTDGFHVTWNVLGITKRGVVTVAHGTTTVLWNNRGYQPTKTDYPIGYCNWRFTVNADTAIIDLDSGITASKKIWSSGSEKLVVGKISHTSMVAGDDVEWTALTSGLRSMNIVNPYADANHPDYGTLHHQVTVDFLSQSGDSGAPVYYIYWEPSIGKYTCIAAGTQFGHDLSVSYFTPTDMTDSAFGVSLSYS